MLINRYDDGDIDDEGLDKDRTRDKQNKGNLIIILKIRDNYLLIPELFSYIQIINI